MNANRGRREFEHGTTSRYRQGCRCDDCRAAKTREQRKWRADNPEKVYRGAKALRDRKRADPSLIPEHVHGTENGYGNYKCRCDECTRAWSAASIARYRRRREKG